nr:MULTISPECIES: hypothetical protein [Nocardia]
MGDDLPEPAAAAEDGGLEVVRMFALLLSHGVRGQHGLDRLPGHWVDQSLVSSGIADAPVGNLALVVRRRQNLVQCVVLDGPRRMLGCWSSGESTNFKLVGHRSESPVACREVLERPRDEVSAFGVDGHRANLGSLAIDHADVHVTEPSLTWRSTALGLLGHALEHFSGKVARVELCDRGHDAVQEHAARGLVDILGSGYQFGSGGPDSHVDLDVVGPVAGQAVDLVDDDVVDAAFLDVGQHLLQFGSVGGLGALATFDELLHDDRAERRGLSSVGLALRGQGVSVRVAVLLGLLLGGYAGIGHGRFERQVRSIRIRINWFERLSCHTCPPISLLCSLWPC